MIRPPAIKDRADENTEAAEVVTPPTTRSTPTSFWSRALMLQPMSFFLPRSDSGQRQE